MARPLLSGNLISIQARARYSAVQKVKHMAVTVTAQIWKCWPLRVSWVTESHWKDGEMKKKNGRWSVSVRTPAVNVSSNLSHKMLNNWIHSQCFPLPPPVCGFMVLRERARLGNVTQCSAALFRHGCHTAVYFGGTVYNHRCLCSSVGLTQQQ